MIAEIQAKRMVGRRNIRGLASSHLAGCSPDCEMHVRKCLAAQPDEDHTRGYQQSADDSGRQCFSPSHIIPKRAENTILTSLTAAT